MCIQILIWLSKHWHIPLIGFRPYSSFSETENMMPYLLSHLDAIPSVRFSSYSSFSVNMVKDSNLSVLDWACDFYLCALTSMSSKFMYSTQEFSGCQNSANLHKDNAIDDHSATHVVAFVKMMKNVRNLRIFSTLSALFEFRVYTKIRQRASIIVFILLRFLSCWWNFSDRTWYF